MHEYPQGEPDMRGLEPFPVLEKASDRPIGIERRKDKRGDNFIVWWPEPVAFRDGKMRKSVWFDVGKFGEPEARRLSWEYFRQRHRDISQRLATAADMPGGSFGPVGRPEKTDRGTLFHGDENHEFVVHARPPTESKEWHVVK